MAETATGQAGSAAGLQVLDETSVHSMGRQSVESGKLHGGKSTALVIGSCTFCFGIRPVGRSSSKLLASAGMVVASKYVGSLCSNTAHVWQGYLCVFRLGSVLLFSTGRTCPRMPWLVAWCYCNSSRRRCD